MENITLEQIDLIMQRANVSYSEAKEALEQTNGDIVEALLLLEKNEKIKVDSHQKSAAHREQINNFISKLNATSFIMYKHERCFIDVPLSIAILSALFCLPFSIVAIVLALVFGVRISIKGENDLATKINSTFDQFTK